MKLNAYGFGFAAANTAFIVFVVCGVFCYLFPEFSAKLMAPLLFYSDAQTYMTTHQVTPYIITLGTIQAYIYSYFTGYIFAYLYNMMSKN